MLSQALLTVRLWLAMQPFSRMAWVLAALIAAAAVLDAFSVRAASGLTRSSYDTMVRWRLWAAPPDPRVLIVDIDEVSLARMAPEFGRWPWPRDALATVQKHLDAQGAAVVLWDISFVDADKLSPGGDAAFDAAVAASPSSLISVTRLSAANDGLSQLTRTHLPNLWVDGPNAAHAQTAPVALLAPALRSLAASRLGLPNAQPEVDGVLRRHRLLEPLADGSALKSLAYSAAEMVQQRSGGALAMAPAKQLGTESLIAWRKHLGAYPRLGFADLFAQAERALAGVEKTTNRTFAGKILIVGSTAPGLHDFHATPLSPLMPGVESLATLVDNAVNGRVVQEQTRLTQALLAGLLCALAAFWVNQRGALSLTPMLLGAPSAMLLLCFASLHTSWFIDLRLAALCVFALLSTLQVVDGLRREHWLRGFPSGEAMQRGVQVSCAIAPKPLNDHDLTKLMDALSQHAPSARLRVSEQVASWPLDTRWPHLARCVAAVHVASDQQTVRSLLQHVLKIDELVCAPVDTRASNANARAMIDSRVLLQWAMLSKTDTHGQANA